MSRKEKVDLCLSCVPVSTRPLSSPRTSEQAGQQQSPELPPGLDHRMGDRPHSSVFCLPHPVSFLHLCLKGFVQHTAILGSHTHSTMWNGESQHDSQKNTEGGLTPLTGTDTEKDEDNSKQGMWQKHCTTIVPVLCAGVGVSVIVIIILAVFLVGKDSQGNDKDPACLERLQGGTPETNVVNCSPAAVCEDDWISYRGKCYYISDQIATWTDSQDFCKSHNSSLAIISNEKEKKFLYLLKANNYWIGLSRAYNDSGWVWTDGTYLSEKFDFYRKPTAPGESENVYLNGEGFKTESGKYPKKWICSKVILPNTER